MRDRGCRSPRPRSPPLACPSAPSGSPRSCPGPPGWAARQGRRGGELPSCCRRGLGGLVGGGEGPCVATRTPAHLQPLEPGSGAKHLQPAPSPCSPYGAESLFPKQKPSLKPACPPHGPSMQCCFVVKLRKFRPQKPSPCPSNWVNRPTTVLPGVGFGARTCWELPTRLLTRPPPPPRGRGPGPFSPPLCFPSTCRLPALSGYPVNNCRLEIKV